MEIIFSIYILHPKDEVLNSKFNTPIFYQKEKT